jgi:hypothetical protein
MRVETRAIVLDVGMMMAVGTNPIESGKSHPGERACRSFRVEFMSGEYVYTNADHSVQAGDCTITSCVSFCLGDRRHGDVL